MLGDCARFDRQRTFRLKLPRHLLKMLANAFDMPIGNERLIRMQHLISRVSKGAKTHPVESVCSVAVEIHFVFRFFAGAVD